MTDRADTTAHQLIAAAAIGRQSGLRYVYAGNRPGRVGDLEDTQMRRVRRDADRAARLCGRSRIA